MDNTIRPRPSLLQGRRDTVQVAFGGAIGTVVGNRGTGYARAGAVAGIARDGFFWIDTGLRLFLG